MVKKICPDVEPFVQASSIAKLALEIWRYAHLKPNQLINYPEDGMNPKRQQSNEALRFFKLYTKLTGKTLRTAEWSIGEHRVGEDTGYRIDGFVLNGVKMEALEFLGCRYHGEFLKI